MGNPSEAEAEAKAAPLPRDAPPPYTPNDSPTASSSSAAAAPSDGTLLPPSNSVSPYQPIPSVLFAHYQWKIDRTFHLGDDSKDHKLYAVSSYAGLNGAGPGKPSIVLHNGPSKDDPALAIAGEDDNWSKLAPQARSTFVVNLPPLVPTATRHLTIHGDKETLYAGTFDKNNGTSFRFSVEVARDGGLCREDFEWRRSSKDELGEYKSGFKLVRLGSASGTGGGNEIGKGSSEADEALAVIGFKRFFSVSRPFRIEFVGTSMHDLGPRWTVMAIITALWLWVLKIGGRAG